MDLRFRLLEYVTDTDHTQTTLIIRKRTWNNQDLAVDTYKKKKVCDELRQLRLENLNLVQQLQDMKSKNNDLKYEICKLNHELKNIKEENCKVKVELHDLRIKNPGGFNYLPDDLFHKVLEFVNENSYVVYGLINKRCNQIFDSYKIPKRSYKYGFAPPSKIIVPRHGEYYSYGDYSSEFDRIMNGIIYYNRIDLLDKVIEYHDNLRLHWFCHKAIKLYKLNILVEVFSKVDDTILQLIRHSYTGQNGLCTGAAKIGNVRALAFLRQNGCEWSEWTWKEAQENGQEHTLQWLRDNFYPLKWQDERKEYDVPRFE